MIQALAQIINLDFIKWRYAKSKIIHVLQVWYWIVLHIPYIQAHTPYQGPYLTSNHIHISYSEHGQPKAKVYAIQQLQYKNQDMSYPNGIQITFYGADHNLFAELKADQAIFTEKNKVYTLQGNVEIYNLNTQEKLYTEVLYWDLNKKQIYTAELVTIESKTMMHIAKGLEANEDFSSCKLFHVQGQDKSI